MSISQLFFNFNKSVVHNKNDVVIGDFNLLAAKTLFSSDKTWISNTLFLYGQSGVGKTFLAKLFTDSNSGVQFNLSDIHEISFIENLVSNYKVILLDDLDTLNDEDLINLFHLYNLSASNSCKLIITSKKSIEELNISLKDLRSRLLSAIIIKIDIPDDISLKAIFFKMLSDKQLSVNMEVIDYILKRVSRNCKSLQEVADKIETFIMKEKKTLNMQTVKNIPIL